MKFKPQAAALEWMLMVIAAVAATRYFMGDGLQDALALLWAAVLAYLTWTLVTLFVLGAIFLAARIGSPSKWLLRHIKKGDRDEKDTD